MKTVIYHGPPISLGRFGDVEEGAHLQLTEKEFACVKDEDRFELISRRKLPGDAKPLGTPGYDLRNIEWSNPRLANRLAKKGRTTLRNIASAMADVGADVTITVHDSTDIIVDRILAEAKALGWTKMDVHEVKALGSVQDVVAADYESLTVKELKALLEARGLSAEGKKPDLVARLIEADKPEEETDNTPDESSEAWTSDADSDEDTGTDSEPDAES